MKEASRQMFTCFKSNRKNPNFKLGTTEQDTVVSAYGKLISNASSDVETVQYASNILKQYNDNFTTYVNDRMKDKQYTILCKGLTMIYSLI